MTNTKMVKKYKKVILDYCKTHSGTSFAELTRAFAAAGLEYEGDKSIGYPGCRNVIIWCNWTEDAITALHELSDEVILEPCPPVVYFLDGMMPDLPLTSHPQSYKKPHWVPYWLQMRH